MADDPTQVPAPPPTPADAPARLPAAPPAGTPAPPVHGHVIRKIPRSIVSMAGTRPVQRPEDIDADGRRGFFSEAMRETLSPFAGILERKINPILAALEALPNQVERIADMQLPQSIAGALDQPQLGPGGGNKNKRTLALPQAEEEKFETLLRPPGALAPGEFESVCSQCGKCVEVCPANAIRIDVYGLLSNGFPYIVARHQPCVVCDSLACMTSCPTGALKLVDRWKLNMGTARVDRHLCVRETGEDCRKCVETCPIIGAEGAPDFLGVGAEPGAGDAIFIHAQTGRVRVRKNICVGCGLCESVCPTDPKAIQVEPRRADVDPIIA